MRLFITQVVPNIFVKKYNVSQAGTMFCFDLVDNDTFEKTISLVPINIKENIKENCHYYKTEFIQCRLLPHNKIFRIFNNLIENITIVKKSIKANTIWFYNITTTNIFSVLILRFILFKKVYAIIADYTPPVKRISINSIIKTIIENLKGIIILSARSDFEKVNQVCIAGIVPQNKINPKASVLTNRKFLFSGVLNKLKGIDMAIEVFSKIPKAELIISGKGDDVLLNMIKPYKNIKYLGFLSQEEYRKVFFEVTFCLNFRNPSFLENKYNFPSKVLEYFLYHKIVISTIEYPELNKFEYIYTPFNVDELIITINKLLVIDNSEIEKYTNNTKQLKSEFSEIKWKSTMHDIESGL